MINLWSWQFSCGYHQFSKIHFRKIAYLEIILNGFQSVVVYLWLSYTQLSNNEHPCSLAFFRIDPKSKCHFDVSFANLWFVIVKLKGVINVIVHGPQQMSVPSGWAKLGNVFFYTHICPVYYLSHDRPLKLAVFMRLSSIFKNSF